MQQKTADAISAALKSAITELSLAYYPNGAMIQDLLRDVAEAFLGNKNFDDLLINRMKQINNREFEQFLQNVFLHPWGYSGIYWPTNSPVTQQLIKRKNLSATQRSNQSDLVSEQIRRYVRNAMVMEPVSKYDEVIAFLAKQEFSNTDIVEICFSYGDPFYTSYFIDAEGNRAHSREIRTTIFYKFILPEIKPTSGFLGLWKNTGMKSRLDEIIFNAPNNADTRNSWLKLLLEHYPEGVGDLENYLLFTEYNRKNVINSRAVQSLIAIDARKYHEAIKEILDKGELEEGRKIHFLMQLHKSTGLYRDRIVAFAEGKLAVYTEADDKRKYFWEVRIDNKPVSIAYTEFLDDEEPARGKSRLEKLFRESAFLSTELLKYVDEKYTTEALPWLIEALRKDPAFAPSYDFQTYYEVLFTLLKKHDVTPYKDLLIDFAVKKATKRTREVAAKTIATSVRGISEDAKKLVDGKSVDERITGALILAELDSPDTAAALNDAVDQETNDDTRDIMLEALQEQRFNVPYTFGQVQQMIALAAARKKLNKWNEKWIDETKLPKVYWQNGTALNEQEVRFLLYRMKRATGLNSDIEARQALAFIDRNRSQPFSKALVVAFQDSNADTKLKHYLTLGALLGDDEMMNILNSLFKKSIADKRVKMAEYVVGALAMIGSDKALRLAENIYRKFSTKKPSVSAAARAALDAAAQELNISMDELSDRIIPNFDFDGIYKKVIIEGEEYRAFISSDFKLNYLNEDNKLRKSLPSNTPKEIKAEFKEIEKEINDVIKLQSVRLEKYMTEDRRWESEQWKQFFFNNPIMFVYAMKLLWSVFDKDGKLVTTFYCSEDASLYDVNDEEVSLEEDQQVAILHPIHLSEKDVTAWKDKLYAMSFITMFPLVEREVFRVSPEEASESVSKLFFKKDIPKGADFVNTFLVKKNWRKGTGDGGRSEFTKSFKDGAIVAYANIDGPTAWYQQGTASATMYEVGFHGKAWNERIVLKDLPAIFYSEVMADIHEMINVK